MSASQTQRPGGDWAESPLLSSRQHELDLVKVGVRARAAFPSSASFLFPAGSLRSGGGAGGSEREGGAPDAETEAATSVFPKNALRPVPSAWGGQRVSTQESTHARSSAALSAREPPMNTQCHFLSMPPFRSDGVAPLLLCSSSQVLRISSNVTSSEGPFLMGGSPTAQGGHRSSPLCLSQRTRPSLVDDTSLPCRRHLLPLQTIPPPL